MKPLAVGDTVTLKTDTREIPTYGRVESIRSAGSTTVVFVVWTLPVPRRWFYAPQDLKVIVSA